MESEVLSNRQRQPKFSQVRSSKRPSQTTSMCFSNKNEEYNDRLHSHKQPNSRRNLVTHHREFFLRQSMRAVGPQTVIQRPRPPVVKVAPEKIRGALPTSVSTLQCPVVLSNTMCSR